VRTKRDAAGSAGTTLGGAELRSWWGFFEVVRTRSRCACDAETGGCVPLTGLGHKVEVSQLMCLAHVICRGGRRWRGPLFLC
jgi:hypothetical protein